MDYLYILMISLAVAAHNAKWQVRRVDECKRLRELKQLKEYQAIYITKEIVNDLIKSSDKWEYCIWNKKWLFYRFTVK